MRRFSRRVVRVGPDRFELRLHADERELIGRFIEELRSLVLSEATDPALERLFPTAYTDHPDHEAEYQRLMRDELLQTRLASIDAAVEAVDAKEVDEARLSAWMRSLNDLRLVLGVRLGVTDDDEPLDLDPEAADAGPRALFMFLGGLLEEVVEALSSR